MAEWTPAAALELITRLSGLDPRLRATTREDAMLDAAAWASALNLRHIPMDVDLMWRRGAHWYEQDRPWRINPGVLIGYHDRDERTERAREPVRPEVESAVGPMPPSAREVFQRAAVVAKEGRARGLSGRALTQYVEEQVPIVRSEQPVKRSPERWMDCGDPKCMCPHERCRGGWLEGDEVLMLRGQAYHAVTRCPTCHDTIKMRGERI